MFRTFAACAVFVLAAPYASLGAVEPALSPEAIQQRIRQHRTAETTLTILSADGKPLANAPVTIRQTRHRFLFGSNAFGIDPANASPAQQAYQAHFSELLNFATLPFYWGSYERQAGQPSFDRVKAMADWCHANRIRTKGHPLAWQQVFPRWAMEKPIDEVWRLQLGRITRDVSAFAGIIDTWDVVNESVSMPNYTGEQTQIPAVAKKVGRVELIRQTFALARKANPKAALIINDYDTSANNEKVIRECLDAGIGIDVVGIQSHMHSGYWGAGKTWEVCSRFANFGKPLHFTEATIISVNPKQNQKWAGRYDDWLSTEEGEQRQAKQVVEFYTILFSHPAVEAITWWDFADAGAWLGAPSGLLKKDMTPKPAYTALLKLVKGDWWTAEIKATTDANGNVTFRGFLGDYAVRTPGGDAAFSIASGGNAKATARLARQ